MYDFVRLAAVVLVLCGAVRNGEPGTDVLPLLVYAAPNALFPLLSLRIGMDRGGQKSCLSLYLAGKMVAVAAGAAWFLLGGRRFPHTAVMAENFTVFAAPVLAALMLFLDALSLLAAWFFMRGISVSAPRGTETAEYGNGAAREGDMQCE